MLARPCANRPSYSEHPAVLSVGCPASAPEDACSSLQRTLDRGTEEREREHERERERMEGLEQ
eukprot:14174175-Alexandrium_andersonii.AAC.1